MIQLESFEPSNGYLQDFKPLSNYLEAHQIPQEAWGYYGFFLISFLAGKIERTEKTATTLLTQFNSTQSMLMDVIHLYRIPETKVSQVLVH